MYECVAINPLGTVVNEIEVRVFEYPHIQMTVENEVVEVTEGDEVDLEFRASGNPAPDMRIECDGKLLEQSSNGEIRLYIPRVTKDHAKQYVCIAKSSIGEDVRYIELNVKTRRGDTGVYDVDQQLNEPSIPSYDYKVNFGDNAILKCDVAGMFL